MVVLVILSRGEIFVYLKLISENPYQFFNYVICPFFLHIIFAYLKLQIKLIKGKVILMFQILTAIKAADFSEVF